MGIVAAITLLQSAKFYWLLCYTCNWKLPIVTFQWRIHLYFGEYIFYFLYRRTNRINHDTPLSNICYSSSISKMRVRGTNFAIAFAIFYAGLSSLGGREGAAECNNWNYCYTSGWLWLSLNVSPRNNARALHLCTTVPTVPLILVGNNRHYVPRHTRDNGFPSPTSPRRLVRTSYNRCSYVPLTRRATITLMHCPVFRRLTTRRHRRFALSQIELNRITGSRVKIIVTRIVLSQLSYDSSSCALSRIKRLDRAPRAERPGICPAS